MIDCDKCVQEKFCKKLLKDEEFEKLPYTVEELSKIKRQCGYKAVVPPYWRSETMFCFY